MLEALEIIFGNDKESILPKFLRKSVDTQTKIIVLKIVFISSSTE